jgi:hypothetical protein
MTRYESLQDTHVDHHAATASQNAFRDAYDTTCKTVSACAREAELIGVGTIGGAIKSGIKHPGETACSAIMAVGTGVAIGAIAAESPVLMGGAVVVGAGMTAAWAWITFNPWDPSNQLRYQNMHNAMQDTWNHSDKSTCSRSLDNMQDAAGPAALDTIVMFASGAAAGKAFSLAPKFRFNTGLTPAFETVPKFYESGTAAPKAGTGASDYMLFMRRHGKMTTLKVSPSMLDAFLDPKGTGFVKDSDRILKVSDNNGKTTTVDKTTGEITEHDGKTEKTNLPGPDGPPHSEETPSSSSFYFSHIKKPY